MPNLVGHSSDEGPLVEVLLGPNARLRSVAEELGMEVHADVYVMLVLGTASSHTIIDAKVLHALGIDPSTGDPALLPNSGNGSTSYEFFDVSLNIYLGSSPIWSFPRLTVAAATKWPKGGRCQGIIGRDVLNKGVFTYKGLSEPFDLSWS